MWHYSFLLLAVVGLSACDAELRKPELLADGLASVSSPITLSPDGATLWVVNPDADSVTAVDAQSLTAGVPIPVGREPWGIAITPSNLVVVMNHLDGSLTLLDKGKRTDIAVSPEPGGLALSPSGRLAYVTVSSADEVAVVDLVAERVVERIAVSSYPWAIAVSDDGDLEDSDETVIVSHRLARLRPQGQEAKNDGKEAWLSVLSIDGKLKQELIIEPYVFGYANALEGLALWEEELFVSHLLNSPELPRTFETTVSGALSSFSLEPGNAPSLRLHLNDSDFSTPINFPRAIALSPDGKTAYLALAGTDAVMGIDLSSVEKPKLLGFWPVGKNPRGIILNREGTRAYVLNYLSRNVSVLDLTDTVNRHELARIPVTPETLEPDMLLGKIIFNNASDPRLSHLGWISCASCHYDGSVDGTTWMTADGLRQTQPLWGLDGTAPFHASATRDEVQDFEHDIEGLMDGVGLASGPAQRELGAPNGGRSEALDTLAAFVLKGIRVPGAARHDEAAFVRGREAFARADCSSCHGGPRWTGSSLSGPIGTLAPNGELEVTVALREVGTYHPETDVLGQNGFDVPTLLGLHVSAPYLHNGGALELGQVLENPQHVGDDLSEREKADLLAFLRSIDENTLPFAP